MANSYFRFKQFTVQQQHCAMKVGTDACIFGAYMAGYCAHLHPAPKRLLDIGTGTGLLSLMIAQKTTAQVDAVEIDADAYLQAKDNFRASPFSGRLTIHPGDILQFSSDQKYDGIVSNPPFYEGDLKSGDRKKDAARHDDSLTLEQLFIAAVSHLAPGGFVAILLPYHRAAYAQQLATNARLFLQQQLLVRHSMHHPFTRVVQLFGQNPQEVVQHEIDIRSDNGDYSPAIQRLLKDYYLNL